MKNDINLRKKEIRKEIKILKKEIAFQEKKNRSEQILSKVEKLSEFINAKTIMLYWSMEDEVHTHDFILKHANDKIIILPSVQGDKLVLKEFNGLESLVAGERYAISEPQGDEFIASEQIEFILVPGVAFDRSNNRMGRGKAYYDKTLVTLDAFKTGICFDFQLLDTVPTDEYDIPMDMVISD